MVQPPPMPTAWWSMRDTTPANRGPRAFRGPCLYLGLMLLGPATARAEGPTVTVQGATVHGSMYLDVPPQRFIDALQDPAWEGRVGANGTTAEIKGRIGPCQHVAYVAPNPILTATYELERCPRPDGWESSHLTSNAFHAYHSRWRAVPEGTGARVTYEVTMDVSLWVPDSFVRGATRKSLGKMLERMVAWAAQTPAEVPAAPPAP